MYNTMLAKTDQRNSRNDNAMPLSIHLSIGAFLHCNFLSFFRLCNLVLYCHCIVSI